jgi:hypothetical protein
MGNRANTFIYFHVFGMMGESIDGHYDVLLVDCMSYWLPVSSDLSVAMLVL